MINFPLQVYQLSLITCFNHITVLSSFMTYNRVLIRVTLWVPLVEHKLLTPLEHLSSPQDFSGVRVSRSLILCLIFCRSLLVLMFFFFLSTIVLSVLLRFTDFDCPFGIFKLFLHLSDTFFIWSIQNKYSIQ